MPTVLTLKSTHVEQMLTLASKAAPRECCGLIGGVSGCARAVYPLANTAANPETSYEAAPEDLFAAQREMRERGEELLAIYHSHPRQAEPTPSETDVRLAYYPQATYLIIGLGGDEPRLSAFRISAAHGSWEPAEFQILAVNQGRT